MGIQFVGPPVKAKGKTASWNWNHGGGLCGGSRAHEENEGITDTITRDIP